MARARNIKPGFFRDADLVELPIETRLLFIGLWTIADRDGRLEDRPKQIKMEIFPADSFEIDAMLMQLHGAGFIERYAINGNKYIQVTNFSKHQNPHRDEKASVLPASNKHDVNTVQTPCNDDANTVAIGLIPESLNLIPEENTLSGKPDETPRQEEQAKPQNKTAIAVLDYLNKVAGTNYQPVKANIDLIAGRMKEGATAEIMKAVIDVKFNEWAGDREYAKYLRPATLFNATKFAQYSGECSPKKRSSNNNYRLHHLGFVEVHSVMGGMSSWSATGFKTIEEYENAHRDAA